VPDLSDIQIAKLIGTTKPTITAVRNRTHENAVNIKPRSPVSLGFCTQGELDNLLAKLKIAPLQMEPDPYETEETF
jgi:hypothetical protein